jgi:N-acetylglutamate synthase-like GNAT family acetyltransferase
MDYVIEPATYADLASLIEPAKKDPEAVGIHPADPDKTRYWVAVVNGTIVGCVASFITGRHGWVKTWYLLPWYRGQGIGKALFFTSFDAAREAGCTIVEVWTRQWRMVSGWGWQMTDKRWKGDPEQRQFLWLHP